MGGVSAVTVDPGSGPVVTGGRRHGTFHPLRVSAVERLTDDSVAVSFDVPTELSADYSFLPGQHLTVRTTLGGVEVRRNYSICSPGPAGPGVPPRLRIGVRRLEGGAFSTHATTDLRVGDVVDVMTPTGRFAVAADPSRARRYCAFAAGSGITPILSIVATVLAVERSSGFTLICGNRTTSSVMFLDDLADLKDRYPARLRLVHVLSREPRESDLLTGRIDGAKARRLLQTLGPADTVDEWFLCGPFAMATEIRTTLLAAGVDAAHVHTELFHVAGEPPREPRGLQSGRAAGASAVTVTLDGRVSTLDVPRAGRRILDAVLDERPDAPYACKAGVCGTCRARLVSGEVSMPRNFALEPEEVAAGFVLACQSTPVSDEVVLDFDA